MKKSMKKFMVACAAASAIAVAAGMSAMAAEVTYNAENNSAPITVPADAAAGPQKTVLVIPETAKNNVTDNNILYIDQGETLPADALLKAGTLADGKYLVMVGYYKADNTFAISEDYFTIGGGAPGGDPSETHEVLMGDVTKPDGIINSMDAQQVLKYAVTGSAAFASNPDKLIAADVAKPTVINSMDAQQILKYSVTGGPAQNVGKTAVVNADGTIVEYK